MPAGRPTILTPELGARICELVKAGNAPETATESCGIHRRQVWEWIEKGNRGLEPYAEFAQSIMRARADAEIRVQGHAQSHMEKDPRTPFEWLRRRNPKIWEVPKPELLVKEDSSQDATSPEDLTTRRAKLAALLEDTDQRL